MSSKWVRPLTVAQEMDPSCGSISLTMPETAERSANTDLDERRNAPMPDFKECCAYFLAFRRLRVLFGSGSGEGAGVAGIMTLAGGAASRAACWA